MAPSRSLTSFVDVLSTAGGLGLLPLAPGTFGSLPGLFFGWAGHMFCGWLFNRDFVAPLLGPALGVALVLVVLASWFATWCIAQTEKAWRRHDDQRIVIDEVVGQMMVAIWVPLYWQWYIAAFVLFRFFDIWKPGPVSWVDKNMGTPFATLLDDLFAALFACVVLGVYFAVFGV